MEKQIRNFCIIAHIDHGKSTLADRFLELTKTIAGRDMQPQILDRLEAEREHGITIKMQPVQMHWQDYELNLIDTPGHIDFSYEVSRALASVEGAILLIDAGSGIQAQTLTVLEKARDLGLKIIPAINKIDLAGANIERVKEEITKLLGDEREISLVSAKTGQGVEELLNRVIREVPTPKIEKETRLKALIFDANFDNHRGAIAYLRIFSGELKSGEKIRLVGSHEETQAREIGIFSPDFSPKNLLSAGDIGYVITDLKDLRQIVIGDTLAHYSPISEPNFEVISGFKKPQPKVFASIFPNDETEFPKLSKAIEILALSDSAFSVQPEASLLLGRGYRIGALGSLHLQILQERLDNEFNLITILTSPHVSYKLKLIDGEVVETSEVERIDFSTVRQIMEPKARVKIILPVSFQGRINELLNDLRGEYIASEYLDNGERLILEYELPLLAVMADLYPKILSLSSGFASMSYELSGYKEANLVKVDVSIADKIFPPLSFLAPREDAYREARERTQKIKELMPQQMFEVDIKAQIGSRVIAKERILALRKDVIAKLYGGDRTRKDKLLNKQKAGKKKMKQLGKLSLPSDFFFKLGQKF
jgi:GTP-binding protein LepA